MVLLLNTLISLGAMKCISGGHWVPRRHSAEAPQVPTGLRQGLPQLECQRGSGHHVGRRELHSLCTVAHRRVVPDEVDHILGRCSRPSERDGAQARLQDPHIPHFDLAWPCMATMEMANAADTHRFQKADSMQEPLFDSFSRARLASHHLIALLRALIPSHPLLPQDVPRPGDHQRLDARAGRWRGQSDIWGVPPPYRERRPRLRRYTTCLQ
jgi:hypothetical protein